MQTLIVRWAFLFSMYKITLSNRARKDLDALPKSVWDRVQQALLLLANDPRPHGYKKLQGVESYRIRVGAYRVIYDIYDLEKMIIVIRVIARKDAYKKNNI